MDFYEYVSETDRLMLSLFLCMDSAGAADKMFSWDNLGENNSVWKTGPYISGPRNGIKINRDQPYCLRVSSFTSSLAGYQMRATPKVSSNGGVVAGHDKDYIKSSIIIPTVSICMQFSLLEEYEFNEFDRYIAKNNLDKQEKSLRRYNRCPVAERMDLISTVTKKEISINLLNTYRSISKFRNKLTHEPSCLCNSPEIALDIYASCQAVAYKISRLLDVSLNLEHIEHRIPIWNNIIENFNNEIEY